MPRLSLDAYYVQMLELVRQRSTCARRKVGAIITSERGVVLSTGYNGVPSGYPHCIDEPCPGRLDPSGDSSRCYAIHAEQNALLQCRQLERAHTLYSQTMPCFICAKLICNTPIKRVVYVEDYPDTTGLHLLFRLGRTVYLSVDVDKT